ncbi:hypothetical protein [Rhizobium rhizogenes]|uniref:hypothetical protein n=1 Tax=Rhizobium rhizogenes TaxID=359 RepID=UPI0024BDE652|nr:hypothetical protein [Rhizobium rhizogenes]MDJ1632510.1 hypothetical protein [Rhizobium rhizogenes]
MMIDQPEKLTVVPHQDYITFEVWDDTVNVTQEGYSDGDQTITIIGKGNLDLMIAALQKVREQWA